MIRRPPRSTRTDTLFPYTPRFRSLFLSAPLTVPAVADEDDNWSITASRMEASRMEAQRKVQREMQEGQQGGYAPLHAASAPTSTLTPASADRKSTRLNSSH